MCETPKFEIKYGGIVFIPMTKINIPRMKHHFRLLKGKSPSGVKPLARRQNHKVRKPTVAPPHAARVPV